MFSNNFSNLLDSASNIWKPIGNDRDIYKGLRINSNQPSELGISWRVRRDKKYNVFGRQGRYLEVQIAEVANVTRKTISFYDSMETEQCHNQHFLYVARLVRPTDVIISTASRIPGEKFVDTYRDHQVIGVEPTALVATVPYSGELKEAEQKMDFRFNLTFKRPGPILIQILDIRYCATSSEYTGI